jgi:hypothetical protein
MDEVVLGHPKVWNRAKKDGDQIGKREEDD